MKKLLLCGLILLSIKITGYSQIIPTDECTGAPVATVGASCVPQTCDMNGGLTASATPTATGCSAGLIVDDGWVRFTATSTSTNIQYTNSNRDANIYLYSGTCGGAMTQLACSNVIGIGTESITYATTIGTQYYIRIGRIAGGASVTMLGTLCLFDSPPPPANDDPCAATALTVNATCVYSTYTTANATATTAGSPPAPGCAFYSGGDVWFTVTVPASGSLVLSSETGVVTDGGMAVYTGTCGALTLLACDDDGVGSSGLMPEIALTCIPPGTVLYVRFWEYGNDNNGTFQLCARDPGGVYGAPSNDDPCAAIALTVSTSCTYANYTNQCASATTAGSPPAPGCANYLGGDVWFTATVPASGQLLIDTQTGVMLDGGMALYTGTCGALTLVSCDDNNSPNGLMPQVSGSGLTPGSTVYIRVWEYGNDNNGTFGICVTDPCPGGAPANDLPCSATALAINVNLSGTNACATATSEPGAATCWTTGNINSVWYTVVCPASGQLKIRTTLGTLANTQIALYSGTCGALTEVACNDNAPSCGTSSYNNSEITATGLTAGATYYIRVDGTNNLMGTFDIMAVDGSIGFPAAAGQDCSFPNPVCSSSILVGNPGYQAYGNICDFNGTGTCLASGERGIAWYTIPINAAGNLAFDIVPNDYGNPNPITGQVNAGYFGVYDETDYDFALWKIAGAGATTCTAIASAAGSTPVRCNYSGLGVTGCFSNTTNNAPAAYNPGYNGAYEQQVPVVAGEVYLLAVSNFSNSTSGFSLIFSATSPINYTGAGSSVTWTGGNNTSWNLSANWGGCTIPNCGLDAVIVPSSSNQPVLTAGTYNVNNLTINPGATLTLQAGAILNVCGNFTNNGSLVAAATSTIVFNNAAVNQSINGALVGADKFGNLTITKTGGTVTLNNNIDIGGTFTTTNNTSVFNTNGNYIRVAGNFANANGSSTFTNVGTTGTLEFNGTAAQTYNQGTSTLTLNNVLMNHTGTGVTALTHMVIGTSGTLTLTLGKIITNANEVQVTNTASAACTAGNASSFVQGNLRRYLNGAATSYNFPVGHATPGYERANITFTTATTIPQLLARFDTWGAVPFGPVASECPTNTYNVLNALNHGYWTISASANPTSGNYDVTLYNQGYTNSAGAAGWTVMKAATGAGPWSLNGTCVTTSTAAQTSRTGLNGFSAFATAQSVTPLPVELVNFTGEAKPEFNHLSWETASETNNDYFVVERSTDGNVFVAIGTVDGAGSSTQYHSYSFNDMMPADGMNYYRLKQVDFNGQATYSNIVSLEFHLGNMVVNNVHPNPTSGVIEFNFGSPEETEIHYVVTDVTGRIIVDEHRTVRAGTSVLSTSLDGQGAGVYSLKVTEEKHGYSFVTRIVKY